VHETQNTVIGMMEIQRNSCGLFQNCQYIECIMLNGRMNDEMERFGRKCWFHIRVTISAFAWNNRQTPRETSAKATGASAEIRSDHFPDKHYRYAISVRERIIMYLYFCVWIYYYVPRTTTCTPEDGHLGRNM
jgi:hypothetical protein